MNVKLFLCLLAAMNVALLLSSGALAWSLKSLAARDSALELNALKEERHQLSWARARLERRVEALGESVARLDASLARVGAETAVPAAFPKDVTDPETSNLEQRKAEFYARLEEALSGKQPDTRALPLLSDEERRALHDYGARFPGLDFHVLTEGNADYVLRSPKWNPIGRVLSLEERAELETLLRDFRYFSKFALIETVQTMVLPEIPKLRDMGAYVEYPEGEAPPKIDGVTYTHAEQSDRPGFLRLYPFPPEDYPDLDRHERVATEQAQVTSVKIHQLLNPGAPRVGGGR